MIRQILMFFSLFFLKSNLIFAQCGEIGNQLVIDNQTDLELLSGCEIFEGNLILTSEYISDLSPLSSLSVVNGSFYLINSSVTDLSPISSLNTAIQILIQSNFLLNSCCAILDFNNSFQLGTISNLSISNNGIICDDNNTLMLECLGYISGCMDQEALNYNPQASQQDGSCIYYCPDSDDDIVDYSCHSDSIPVNCNPIIVNQPSDGAGHFNNPVGLCYEETPPSSGPHRPMWGRWGEYEYMPPQRYIHNLEHGGIALLYHPCAPIEFVDSLRSVACSRGIDDGGDFRWILTPYADLPTNIAIVAWEWTYFNDCFEFESINNFINNHYRNAPEDFYYNGTYDTLYIGKCEAFGCNDISAINFESSSLIDNGSCIYPSIDTQLVILNDGWSIFSTYISTTSNDNMSNIFSDISNQTVIVKNNLGSAYLPDWDLDISLVIGEGYFAKMNSNATLQISGTQIIPELNPIDLIEGWNLIGYLRDEPVDIILVFQDIYEHVIIVKDGLGNIYYPDWNYNNIGEMNPGEGYQIKMSSSTQLEYLSNDEEY
tara:strand:- start:552 stop:2183 length:1632 start_codon:yes stop_codon:yes gene_type:complete